MSKSLGNVMLPSKIQKQFGADILRLWVASVDYQADVRISHEILKQVAENYRKVRNTFRFLLGNLNDFDPKVDTVNEDQLEEIDLYMLYRLQTLIKKVRTSFDAYDFADGFNDILNFVTIDLSAFYLDFAKDILYIEETNSQDRKSTRLNSSHVA